MNEEATAGIILIILIAILLGLATYGGFDTGKTAALAQKCAETQGKYDFCVQKISYEVKQ